LRGEKVCQQGPLSGNEFAALEKPFKYSRGYNLWYLDLRTGANIGGYTYSIGPAKPGKPERQSDHPGVCTQRGSRHTTRGCRLQPGDARWN
jgi:hypothetical protein